MKKPAKITLCGLLVLCSVTMLGCGKKADEDKPITEVQAEAEKMNVDQLRKMALEYKQAIEAKQDDIEKITAQLKEIPLAKALGEEAKSLKADIDELNKSVSALRERFQIYYDKLKLKGGDVTGL